MTPLDEISGNARTTRSSTRAQKGPAALQGTNTQASGQFTRNSNTRKRKAPVEWESDLDEDEYVDAEPMDDEDLDYEQSSDVDEYDIFEFDEEEDKPEPEADFDDLDDLDDLDDESTALPFDNAVGPSDDKFVPRNADRYKRLFHAVMVALKEASADIIYNECGGYRSFFNGSRTEPLPIHPRWLVGFEKGLMHVIVTLEVNPLPFMTLTPPHDYRGSEVT